MRVFGIWAVIAVTAYLVFAICIPCVADVRLQGAGGRVDTVKTVEISGCEYVSARDIAKILGGTFLYDPLSRKIVIDASGKKASVLTGSLRLAIAKPDQTFFLGNLPDTPIRHRGESYLSTNAAESFLDQFHKSTFTPLPTSLLERIPIPVSPATGRVAPFIRNIVIDAGHGDHDAGAIGPGGTREKDVNLGVALKLAEILKSRVAGKITLTRSDDRFLTLQQRVDVAKRVKADLFISIHSNSAPGQGGRSASGTEVYFFSSPSDADARRAERLHGGPFDPRAEGVDPVLFDLMLAGNVIESNKFAELIASKLPRGVGLPNRGVKSARFYVMYYGVMSNIPSILVELGFLSNPAEEAKLKDAAFQMKAASALADATVEFLKDLEKRYPNGRGWSR